MYFFMIHKKCIKKLDKLRVVPYTISGSFTHLLGHRHRVLRDVRHRGTRHFSTATLVSLYLKADLTQADLAWLFPGAYPCRAALFSSIASLIPSKEEKNEKPAPHRTSLATMALHRLPTAGGSHVCSDAARSGGREREPRPTDLRHEHGR